MDQNDPVYPLDRRRFLQQATLGFGTIALACLLEQETSRAAECRPAAWIFVLGAATSRPELTQ